MRQPIIFMLLICLVKICAAQEIKPYTREPGYDKYNPVNELVRKNQVSCITDSSDFLLPYKVKTQCFDSLGRLVGDLNGTGNSFLNRYDYRVNGDTVYRLKFSGEGAALQGYERFVLNRKGHTTAYLSCSNYNATQQSYYVNYEQFMYDEQERLTARRSYVREDYPGEIDDKVPVNISHLRLNDAVYYKYYLQKNGNRMVIGTHILGNAGWRETDSALYDRHNRLTRFNTFSKRGAMGEMVQNQVNRISEYRYTDSSLHITSYTTYCRAPYPVSCPQYETTEKEQTLIVYNPNKTKKAVYGFYASGEKYLVDAYTYVTMRDTINK